MDDPPSSDIPCKAYATLCLKCQIVRPLEERALQTESNAEFWCELPKWKTLRLQQCATKEQCAAKRHVQGAYRNNLLLYRSYTVVQVVAHGWHSCVTAVSMIVQTSSGFQSKGCGSIYMGPNCSTMNLEGYK